MYLYSFFDLGARWGGLPTPRPGRFRPRNNPVPIVKETGWASGAVGTGEGNLPPPGIRSPDCPVRNKSLHRLRYPYPFALWYIIRGAREWSVVYLSEEHRLRVTKKRVKV